MKRLKYVMTMIGIASATPNHALADLSLKILSCPQNINSTITNPPPVITVTVQAINNDCSKSVTLTSWFRGRVGNSYGTLQLYGPYVYNFSTPRTVPKAICSSQYGYEYVQTPGVLNIGLPFAQTMFPAALNNTLAILSAGVKTSTGDIKATTCVVTVLP